MRKTIKTWQVIIFLAFTATLFSCDSDSDEPKNPETSSLSKEAQEIYDKLSNTTWTLISSPYDNAPLGNTITFSSTIVSQGVFQLFCSSYPSDIFAWMPTPDGGGDLLMTGALTACNAANAGSFITYFGSRVYLDFSGNSMSITSTVNSNKKYVYTKSTSGSSSDPISGGEDGFEKPDVGFYDYTQQGKSSVKVDFIIYNKNEAGVSSATIKYGTTSTANSSASTNIVGDHVIATISGLKSDTKYYVKCTVKGKGGTVTTESVAISLSSW
ncbi:MAG: hypothetical protein NC453_24175 [Muribaculum sp.]|nr:hypothetical protein [Muribaculum sp.]